MLYFIVGKIALDIMNFEDLFTLKPKIYFFYFNYFINYDTTQNHHL